MFRFPPNSTSRRTLLRFGVRLGIGGLSAAVFDQRRATQAQTEDGSAQNTAKSCVFIFLFGGPSHVDLWDLKPHAPREIRGEFEPIATDVPGIQLCEHLPLLAQQMKHVCLLRSMTHRMPVHGPACSEIYSGRPYFGAPVTDQAREEDWPSIASLVHRFAAASGPLPPSIVLPWYTQFVGQDRRIAGQTGGRMGEQFNPFLIAGDLTQPDFRVDGLQLPPEVSVDRLQKRRVLRRQLEPLGLTSSQQTPQTRIADDNFQAAAALVERSEAAGVLDLEREPTRLRERYGNTRFGQSLLLARRLVEADVSLVTVNWDDEHKDDKVSPHWDTHVENFPKLKDRLCPPFDRAMSAFLTDLADRGLLESTLVVALGEFGRSPKIGLVTQNGMTKRTGRDHWPHAFTALIAGGGVRGGQVYGATTETGGYVADNPVTPADLTATIFDHLGIDQRCEYDDRFLKMRQPLTNGRPVDLA
ncbi:DUF1501 domain-containing protein [bacterium]|nr:DUF1501 domain-containing protein [bacterium]